LNYLKTDNAPRPIGPYSQAIEVNGFIFTSGQIALDPEKGEIVSTNIEQQTHRVIKNLQAVLESGNSSLAKVVKTTIFLSNMDHFATVNSIYGEYFNQTKPARSTVEVRRLPKDALIEIDCIAMK